MEKIYVLFIFCFLIETGKTKTTEKPKPEIDCYDYCTGSDTECKDLGRRLDRNISTAVNNTKKCNDSCIAKHTRSYQYYYCGTPEDKDECETFNQNEAICISCNETNCNSKDSLEQEVQNRSECYYYCTGERCKDFKFPPAKRRYCPPGFGCIASREAGGDIFKCVSSDECPTSDELHRPCVYCESNLCNTEEVLDEDEKLSRTCFRYCKSSYAVVPAPLTSICDGMWNFKVGHRDSCPLKTTVGCSMRKYGGLEIYDCANKRDSDHCKNITSQGQAICGVCNRSMCNTPGRMEQVVNSRKPKGVTACYFYDHKDTPGSPGIKVESRICPDIYKSKIRCLSVRWKPRGGSSVNVLKTCANSSTQSNYQEICKLVNLSPEGKCYFCDKDLCNLGHGTIRAAQTKANETYKQLNATAVSNLRLWWSSCFPLLSVMLINVHIL